MLRTILIYTTGDFPYGMAPESLVRQMALGLKYHEIKLKIIRLRGKWYDNYNDTGILAINLFLLNKPNKEFTKFVEFLSIIFLGPFSVIFNKAKHKPYAIILYGVEYFYFVLPFWLACKLTRIKLIRITTDLYKESTIVPVWWKRPKLYFFNFQFKYFDRHLNGIVCLSYYLAEFALNSGVKPERVTVIPHFIDTTGFCEGVVKHQPTGKTRIGFCGFVSRSNGIYDLLEAFKLVYAEFHDTELYIIGEPSPEERDTILKMIEPFKTAVTITGLHSKKEIPGALLSCHILINPRKSGEFAEAGFPTKLGEYFSTGLPVVSTAVGDIRHYFTNKVELMLVPPDQPEKIAEAVMFLMNNKSEAYKIGGRGFEWAKANLDYKQNSGKLLQFIKSL